MSDAHLTLTIDAARRLVHAVRTAAPVDSATQVAAMTARAGELLRAVARRDYGILVDLRQAPLAVESRFAAALTALRQELTRDFGRAAFLVETQVGRLQVQRFVREEKLAAAVFDDEAAARAHLTAR